jgi:UDP-3-O-[3-hydroxymyristoyl] glucosamine N-acyltransferase
MGIQYTLKQVQSIIGGKIIGNGDTIITDVASVETAKDGSITFIKDNSLIPQAMKSMASAIVVHREIQALKKPQIVVENPFLAFTRFTEVVAEERYKRPAGIHPMAIISKEATVGKGVSIGAYVVPRILLWITARRRANNLTTRRSNMNPSMFQPERAPKLWNRGHNKNSDLCMML